MADRYWVGGSGTWSSSATTNWSTVSGGAGGASAPTSTDDVFFDANSNVGTGAFTVTISSANCRNFTASGLDGAMTLAFGSSTLNCYGSWINPATNFTTTSTSASTLGGIFFQSTAVGNTITTNGRSLTNNIRFNGSGSYVLDGALSISLARILYLNAGTLDLNGYTLSAGNFSASNTTIRTLAFGTGNISIYGSAGVAGGTNVFSIATATNLTVTGTPVVNITAVTTSTRSVSFGGLTTPATSGMDLNITGGTGTVNVQGSVKNISCAGFAGLFGLSGSLYLYGDITFSPTMSGTASSANVLTFFAPSGTQNFTSYGHVIQFYVSVGVSGSPNAGVLHLQDAISFTSTYGINVAIGGFVSNNYSITAGYFSSFTLAVRTISLGSSLCTFIGNRAAGAWEAVASNLTFTSGTSTISLTSASPKLFSGGGLTYYNVNQGGAGTLTITGNNTFNNITNTVQPTTVLFTAGTTSTFLSGFSLSGTAGNLVTIGSPTAATHTLSKVSGSISVSYCSISNSIATGGATWDALTVNGNVNAGNNSGWRFDTFFTATVSEAAVGVDYISVLLSLDAVIIEQGIGVETIGTQMSYYAALSENTVGVSDITSVIAGSVSVTEQAVLTDIPNSGFAFVIYVDEVATIFDEVASRFLWNLIDDGQTPGWAAISNNQITSWSTIDTNTNSSWDDTDTT